jgi:hypothetical protein
MVWWHTYNAAPGFQHSLQMQSTNAHSAMHLKHQLLHSPLKPIIIASPESPSIPPHIAQSISK